MSTIILNKTQNIVDIFEKEKIKTALSTMTNLIHFIDSNHYDNKCNDIFKIMNYEFCQKLLIGYYKGMVHNNVIKIPNALRFHVMLHMSDISDTHKNEIDKVLENICEQLLEESTVQQANKYFPDSIIDEDEWICSLSEEANTFWEYYISQTYL